MTELSKVGLSERRDPTPKATPSPRDPSITPIVPPAPADGRAARRLQIHTRLRAQLRQAVWEASQTMSTYEIEDFVYDVLGETERDKP